MSACFGQCQPGDDAAGEEPVCVRAACWFMSKTRNLGEKLKAKPHVKPQTRETRPEEHYPFKSAAAWEWGCSVENGRCVKKKDGMVGAALPRRACPVPLWSQGHHAGRLVVLPLRRTQTRFASRGAEVAPVWELPQG